MYIVTSPQMAAAEAACVERRGIRLLDLMESAGCACAGIITAQSKNAKTALIVCGKGKNAGDGFVIARKLTEAGCRVTVLLACGAPRAEDSLAMLSLLDGRKVEIVKYEDNAAEMTSLIENSDIIVDCIFGTGFTGALDSELSALVTLLNAGKAVKYSIDAPSGMRCDEAAHDGVTMLPDATIAIAALKFTHVIKPECELCGRIEVADIGISEEDYIAAGISTATVIENNEIKALLPARPSVSNKGTFGHALSICGSKNMQGAAVIAASGALRLGAGLVTAAFPESAYAPIAAKLTEPLLLPLPCDEQGFFAQGALTQLLAAQQKATAVLLGCGLGLTEDTKKLVFSLIERAEKPMIIDADGINAVACNIDILKAAGASLILTPHPGEMSRLCGKSIAEILENPIEIAGEFAQKYSVTVVLKTANTVVCSPKKPIYINSTGNSGLARGGSGDLLAGMVLGLLAQGLKPYDAAKAAVYLHGLCADKYAAKAAKRAFLPTELARFLPELLSDFE